jgi:hypothetical protein
MKKIVVPEPNHHVIRAYKEAEVKLHAKQKYVQDLSLNRIWETYP